MLIAAVLGLTLVAQAATPDSAASAPPVFDIFSTVLAPEQRAHLGADPRCADAKRATDTFADLRDARDGVTAMLALEKCAVMPRVGNWADFRDYTLTAAGAVGYSVGVTASEPKALERALHDLSLVFGYETPSSRTVVVLGTNAAASGGGPMMPSPGQIAMETGLPMQNSVTRTHETTHQVGYSGPYGALATQVGEAAQAELDALKRGAARPQERSK